MALIRVAQYNSTPTVVEDYQAQNAHLQAFTNQLLTQQFILDSGTAQPVIKQGCYVSHGGSLYVADADTSITGSPGDGSVYIRVSGTTSLTVEFVTDISGYAWNPVYTALTSSTYTLLPYLIVKASTVWTRYNFNPNNQSFGSLASLSVTGNITVDGTVDGHDINSELNTLNGRVNQGVKTTDSPTFITLGFASLNPGNSTETSIELSGGASQVLPKGAYAIELDSEYLICQMKHSSSGSGWINIFEGTGGFVISDGVNFRLRNASSSVTYTANMRKW
jgi:hypothetical protein